jgi:hypothetical protein
MVESGSVEAAVDALLTRLRTDSRVENVVFEELRLLGPACVPVIMGKLDTPAGDDDDAAWNEQYVLLRALASIGNTVRLGGTYDPAANEAVDFLMDRARLLVESRLENMLIDPDQESQAFAALEALAESGRLDTNGAVRSWLDAIKPDADVNEFASLSWHLLDVLARYPEADDVRRADKFLASPIRDVQVAAQSVLRPIRWHAKGVLLEHVRHRDDSASRALGVLRLLLAADEVKHAVTDLRDDPEAPVELRRSAARILYLETEGTEPDEAWHKSMTEIPE